MTTTVYLGKGATMATEKTINESINRKMRELNATVETHLTVAQWNAIERLVYDYKPGNDRNKSHSKKVALDAIQSIRPERTHAISKVQS
jgi:hypothetical protein